MNKQARRYQQKNLDIKKIIITIISIILIILFVIYITKQIKIQKNNTSIEITKYFPIYKDQLYGVIDQNGNLVIDPYYKEMITIPDNEKDLFIILYDVDYVSNSYKSKVINSSNQEILKDFECVEAISYLENSNVNYVNNCLTFKNNSKKGIIDFSGNIICDPEFDDIIPMPKNLNFLLTIKDGKYGLIDISGKIIIDNKYKDIKQLKNINLYIVQNDKMGIVDNLGNVILDEDYEYIYDVSTSEIYVIKDGDNLRILDKNKNEIKSDDVYDVISIDRNIIYTNKDGLYGVKDFNGNNLLEPIFGDVKQAYQDNFIVKNSTNKYGIIDKNNNLKAEFSYEKIIYDPLKNYYICNIDQVNQLILDGDFNKKLDGIIINQTDDYIKVRKNGNIKYYNYKFEEVDEKMFFENSLLPRKENSKYGFIDKKGNLIVDYIYDDITPQNEYGYISVKKGNKWGAIDSNGNVIIEPIYNLDNYLNLNFIGRYHRGIDYSIEYYTNEDIIN